MSNSYKDIIKSSGLIAYVQIFQMIFGLARNKVVALVLGTAGFGIWGLFSTFMEMVTAFSTLGIDQSGVRDIAKKSEDKIAVAKCVFVFRTSIILMSCLLCVISIIFSKTISLFLFNSSSYQTGVIALSFVIIFKGISCGNVYILNGLRKLSDLAKGQIYGTIIGSLSTILLVLLWKDKAIPWALLSIGLTLAISTGWFVSKLHITKVKVHFREYKEIFRPLFILGLSFSFSALISTIMTLLSRSYLSSHFDLGAVGIYQASWTISNLYIGIILSAMGVDFMPRLMKVFNDNKEVNVLINQQLEMGILLSSLGVVGILLFSDLFLYLLYSKEFIVGSEIIRWQVLGVAMRIFAFPFSYAIAAKGKALLYAITQLIFWTLDYLLLMFFGNIFGFDGLGVNYVVAYSVFVLMVYVSCQKIYSFKIARAVQILIIKIILFILVAWFIAYLSSGVMLYVLSTIELIVLICFINHYMVNNMGINLLHLLRNRIRKK